MTESRFLTDAERDRFARWLEMEADTDKGMIEQAKELPHMEVMVKRMTARMHAYLIVADVLRKTESMTISG